MNVSNQIFRVRLLVALALRALGGARESGLVVEAVEIAAGVLEFLHPLLGLWIFGRTSSAHPVPSRRKREEIRSCRYLGDHHMAVECSAPVVLGRLVYVLSDFSHDRRAECEVRHKVAIPSTKPVILARLRHNIAWYKTGPYMISTWSQSAPCSIVLAQSAPSCAKSADRMEGAMIAFGAMVANFKLNFCVLVCRRYVCWQSLGNKLTSGK